MRCVWKVSMLFSVMAYVPANLGTDSDEYRAVGPGFPGFVAIACLAIAVILLIVSMARRIRRLDYQPPVETAQAELVEQGQTDEVEREARRRLAEKYGENAEPGRSPQA